MKRIIAFLTRCSDDHRSFSGSYRRSRELELDRNFKTKIQYENEQLTGKSELSLEALTGEDLEPVFPSPV